MSTSYSEAGNKGDRVKSDCWIALTLSAGGGIKISLESKVKTLFGRSIKLLLENILDFYNILHAQVEIVDAGATDFVIMARMESAIRKLGVADGKEFLPELKYPFFHTERHQFRRSRLYIPGDQPKLFLNAALHKPDGLILDLEDSVPPAKKLDARILVRNALRSIDFMGAERMVRINQLPMGFDDLEAVIPQGVNLVLIPKVETPEQIYEIDKKVNRLIKEQHIDGSADLFYMPIIESALGIINAYAIATASKRIVALSIGLEDFTADIGVQRTNEGKESFYARSVIVVAAKAAGIQAIDTVFSDVRDMEGLKASVLEAKALGFDGKGCIHPRQIREVHDAFAPTEDEINRAKKIVLAFEDAEKKGLGVVALGSKMIEAPVVKRALRTIEIAIKEGSLMEDWRKSDEETN